MRLRGILRFRVFSQILGVILPNAYLRGFFNKPHLYNGKAKAVILPILNCYACPSALTSCPAGALQHFSVIKTIPFYIFGVIAIFGAAVGRLFCGWVCPFGFLQDLLYKIKTPKVKLPSKYTFTKYIFLVLGVLLLPMIISDTVFCKICPQGALEAGIPQMLLNPELRPLAHTLYWTKIAILVFFIAAFIFTKRPFCRYVCPVGTLLSLFNSVSLLRLTVDHHKCTLCGYCKLVCPVDIEVFRNPNSTDCIRCGLCTTCPENAVKFTTVFAPEENPKPALSDKI